MDIAVTNRKQAINRLVPGMALAAVLITGQSAAAGLSMFGVRWGHGFMAQRRRSSPPVKS